MTLNSLESYGIGFQTKVMSALLTDKPFLQNVNDILTEEYFSNTAHKWIVDEVLKYYAKYHCNPTMDVLKVEMKRVDNEVLQLSIKEQLKEAYRSSDESDLTYVKEEFTNFCKNQQLKKALLNSVDLLKAGDYDSIRTLVDNALRSGQDKNIGHEYNKDVESRYIEDDRRPIPTPWGPFNEILQGGLGIGDLGLIFGNPGGGKSWCLIALGAHAVQLGYNVIHYTLELGEGYVGRRYDAVFTGIQVDKLKHHRNHIGETIEGLDGNLIVREYPMGKATISTIESHIKKCIDLDFNPDLIIIDYIDLLSSKKKNRERKDEIDDIYIGTKGLARELKLPIWSVSQVNRAGAKDNIIEGDKAAGSYDKIMIADVAMSLSRQKKDKVNGTGRFHIMKNRYGGDGMSYNAKVDTSNGHIEILNEMSEDEEDEQIKQSNSSKTAGFSTSLDNLDREYLQQQFFALNGASV
jgi:replicative DNA helicase